MKTAIVCLALCCAAFAAFGQEIPGRLKLEPGDTHRWRVNLNLDMDMPEPRTGAMLKGTGQMDYTAEVTVLSVGPDAITADLVAKDARGFMRIDSAGKTVREEDLSNEDSEKDTFLLILRPDGKVLSARRKELSGGLQMAGGLSPGAQFQDMSAQAQMLFTPLPPRNAKRGRSFRRNDTTKVSAGFFKTTSVAYNEYVFKGFRDTLGKRLGLFTLTTDSARNHREDPETGALVPARKGPAQAGVSRVWFDPETGLQRQVASESYAEFEMNLGGMFANVRQKSANSSGGAPARAKIDPHKLNLSMKFRIHLDASYLE